MMAAELQRRRRAVLFVVVALWFGGAGGQEFRPYPATRITEAQWMSYFTEVRRNLGESMEELRSDKLILFSSLATQTSYAFTQAGHPAHPAWIARQVVEADGAVGIRQIGYFAGDQRAFAAMYRSYQDLNDRIREVMREDQNRTRPQ
jgi:hypothetical protein